MARNDLQGSLDLLVLMTLAQVGEMHGYGIVLRIQRASDELLNVEEGSLYPALHRMDQNGWIRSEWKLTKTGRKAKYYLSEAVLISLIGGFLGTAFSFVLLRTLSTWQPFSEFPVHVTVVPDPRVYVLALFLSLATGVFFGLLPVRQIWKTDGTMVVSHGEAFPVFRRFALRDVMLGIQFAICTLLVMSSLLALRGMANSLHAPLGFEPQGVTLVSTDMHMAG